MARADWEPSTRVYYLYLAARSRPGNQDPFIAWWDIMSSVEVGMISEMRSAARRFKELEGELDGSEGKLEEWREQYDVAVDAESRWFAEQHWILGMEGVKKFVDAEEALVFGRDASAAWG